MKFHQLALSAALAITSLLVSFASFAITQPNDIRQQTESFLKGELAWISDDINENNQTSLRIKQASTHLIETIAVWDANHELIFPDTQSSTHLNDYIVTNNYPRLEALLQTATPTAWEAYDINVDALFFCQSEGISVCLLLKTADLAAALGIQKDLLVTGLLAENKHLAAPGNDGYFYGLILILLTILMGSTAYIFFQRKNKESIATSHDTNDIFEMGDMKIDPRRMCITRGDYSEQISVRDLKLLTCLFQHPDEVVSKDKLYNAGWGRDFVPSSRSLEQHIVTLRKKLDPKRQYKPVIETVHGQGYRFPKESL
ncbi:winged helix-turn-helix domain-containing protein [Neptuniibacter sp. QD34_54]|uniref:winged helix-turn-helix domain-containing protein n=1 Tax=Neptuniibacter sp. QD34_54 TaxID=3398208 RepID=UPI0039F44F07